MRRIALPVEFKVRELDGKLWLALNLAIRGFKVAIGEMGSTWSGTDLIRPDIYIDGNALYGRQKVQLYRELSRNNVKLLVLDAEGGIFQSNNTYAQRLSMEILGYVDRFLAWGNAAADILRKYHPGFPPDRIVVTGNPRFDLVQKQFRQYYAIESSHLKEEFGNYVLVNTNFTTANHFSKDIGKEIYQKLRMSPPDSEFEAYQRKLFDCFIEGIICLSNQFPDLTIIVRPHPSENHTTYKALLASCNNVHVEHRGAVRPWILGAIVIVHNSCTTGIESALLGKPVLAFQPVKHAEYDQSLPNMVSRSVGSADGLCNEVSKLLGGAKWGGLSSIQEKELQHFIYNAKAGVISANLICNVVDSLERVGANKIGRPLGLPRAAAKRRIKAALGSKGIKLIRRIRGQTEGALYAEQKFPSLSKAEIRTRVDKLRACGIDAENLRIERIRKLDKAFWIYKV